MELETIVSALNQAFNKEKVKIAVLSPEWLQRNTESEINCTGFCYAASEVIYRLNGGKTVWKKVSIARSKWEHGGHCYLIKKENNAILDITREQYSLTDIDIPYNLGKAGGFRQIGKKAELLAYMAGLPSLR
ncbi:hypothetical protein BH09BAC1_BH09BAC1_04810 [soil metagenome]